MSNGDPPDSGAPYIIICSGRIGVALAKSYGDKVLTASICAARFAAFMGTVYGSKEDFVTDLKPITTIQHELMNHAVGNHILDHAELDAKFSDLFAAMSVMEGKY